MPIPTQFADYSAPETCPGCGAPLAGAPNEEVGCFINGEPRICTIQGAVKCPGCGGVVTVALIGQWSADGIVRSEWADGDVADEDLFYFDLCIVKDDGSGWFRFHGWADQNTRRLVQIG